MSGTTVEVPTRVLVLGMAREDGTIRAEEVYPVATACGQSPEQVRSCLRRLVAQGLFRREGNGRSAVYVATEAGHARITGGHRRLGRAYAQDAAGQGWDRRWRLAAFAVPETRRAGRDGLRDALLGLGGAPVQGGLYVSPHPWDDEVRAEAKRLGLDEHLSLVVTDELEIGGVRDPRELTARLWPVEEVASKYRAFVERYRTLPQLLEEHKRRHRHLDDLEFLPQTFTMALAYAECASADPHLPPELLPRPWPGREARDIVGRSRRLALLLRSGSSQPALFGLFDQMLRDQPLHGV